MNRRELIKLIGLAPLVKVAPVIAAGPSYIKDRGDETGYHLLVYGATPGGVACAIRAAREGLKVVLVSTAEHLGGMFVNGLGITDTLYNGARAPLYDEFRQGIYDFYRLKYGKDSPQYKASGPGISKTKYEAHVAEQLINEWLSAELNITIIKGFYPVSAEKNNKQITRVGFRMVDGKQNRYMAARLFADCSYEGDLASVAGAPYRIGRESRQEYGEKYAGVIYSKDVEPGEATHKMSEEQLALSRDLNLFRYKESGTMLLMPESTGEADDAIQGFNFRTILTDDPNNRFLPDRPANYDAAHFRDHYTHKPETLTLSRPNRKSSLPYPEILGLQNKYVEGDWAIRGSIIEQFRNEVIGLLYFRQNDASLTPALREHWRKYGLAKDEFPDNGHMPYELYVREARRIRGKAVFAEHDAQLTPGLKRAPVHSDSIGVTEWFLDSHACTDRKVRGSKEEGEVMLKTETVPGQISLRAIFPLEPDNLMVPVCLSASHIGLGAIRLEPVWMGIGEVAGYIAALVPKTPGGGQAALSKIDPDKLTRKLAQKRFMISFFNDVEGREYASWYPAIQYLGTKGFFGSYEARPDRKLTKALAQRWTEHLRVWKETRNWDATSQALKTVMIEEEDSETISATEFSEMIKKTLAIPMQAASLLKTLGITGETIISRGDAARVIFEATGIILKS